MQAPHDFPTMPDRQQLAGQLDREGYAMLPGLFDRVQASALAALIGSDTTLNGIPSIMGSGAGKVLRLPQKLPEPLDALRAGLYEYLLPIANGWNETMGSRLRFPATFDEFSIQNHKSGHGRPLSCLGSLREHDFQALHQHTEGRRIYPLQLVALLSEPGKDFTGGEFVMTEQRPRMQSRPIVLPLRMGDAAIVAVAQRPVKGSKGSYRVNIKHAVSRVRSGERIGLELVFHDAPCTDAGSALSLL
jgi:hypothetical protein